MAVPPRTSLAALKDDLAQGGARSVEMLVSNVAAAAMC